MKKQKTTWWDKLGNPQYGGEMVIRADRDIMNFDPYFGDKSANIDSAWMEKLQTDDWTMNPTTFDYKTCWRPSQHLKGQRAESWEFTASGANCFSFTQRYPLARYTTGKWTGVNR